MIGPAYKAPTYTDGSTKNMNLHLEAVHGMTTAFPTEPSPAGRFHTLAPEESQNAVSFARGIQRLSFNSDIFKGILIRWIYCNNNGFRVVEQPGFRLILKYLLGCVCTSFRVPKQAHAAICFMILIVNNFRHPLLGLYEPGCQQVVQQFAHGYCLPRQQRKPQ